jgi:cell division protein ZapA
MSEQGISVRIAGRTYPMTVESPEEEETVRKAEKIIRERMALYEKNYAISDPKDLLSMTVLQFATEVLEMKEEANEGSQEVADKLNKLNQLLSGALA